MNRKQSPRRGSGHTSPRNNNAHSHNSSPKKRRRKKSRDNMPQPSQHSSHQANFTIPTAPSSAIPSSNHLSAQQAVSPRKPPLSSTSSPSSANATPSKLSYAARISSAGANPSARKSSLRIRSGSGGGEGAESPRQSQHGRLPKDVVLKIRMQQRDICYVAGLPRTICSRAVLASAKWFGQFGRIKDMTITDNANCIRTNWMCAHIKYFEESSASRAVAVMNQKKLDDGRILEANYGTQRYCEFFVNGKKCHKSNCPFRHSWCKLSEVVNFNQHHQIIPHQQQQQQQQQQNGTLPQVTHGQMAQQGPMMNAPSLRAAKSSSVNSVMSNHSNHSQNSKEAMTVVTPPTTANGGHPPLPLPAPSIRPPKPQHQQQSQQPPTMTSHVSQLSLDGGTVHSVTSTSSTDLKHNDINHVGSDNPVGNESLIQANYISSDHEDHTHAPEHATNNPSYDEVMTSNLVREQQIEMHELYQELQCIKEENKHHSIRIHDLESQLRIRNTEVDKLQTLSRRMYDGVARLKAENAALANRNQQLVSELEQHKTQSLDLLDYTLWTWQDVFHWMLGLDGGRFRRKYGDVLGVNLKLENIDGSCVKCLSVDDMHRIGIVDYKDKQMVMEAIASLKSNLGLDNLMNDLLGDAPL